MDERDFTRRLVEITKLWTHSELITADMLLELPNDGYIHALSTVMLPHPDRRNRRLAIVQRPFLFSTTLENRRIGVVVPPDFVTDFASLPAITKIFTSQIGKHAEATVIHDWLYAMGTPGDEAGRLLADQVFREAMIRSDVHPTTIWCMYTAVRQWGQQSYGRRSDFRFRDAETLEPYPQQDVEDYRCTVAVRPDLIQSPEAHASASSEAPDGCPGHNNGAAPHVPGPAE